MKLDNFQQFVKDGEYESNLNVIEVKSFMRKLITFHTNKADDIESNVNGAINFGDIYSNSIYHNETLSVMLMDEAIKYNANKLIETTLEEIEDIEELNANEVEPEDCVDVDKRAKELNK